MVQYEPLVITIYKCIENVKTRWDNNFFYHCHCHCKTPIPLSTFNTLVIQIMWKKTRTHTYVRKTWTNFKVKKRHIKRKGVWASGACIMLSLYICSLICCKYLYVLHIKISVEVYVEVCLTVLIFELGHG